MESLDLKEVFFEALDYPEYARPDFFIRKQLESGWSRGVYLTALNQVYYDSLLKIQIHYRSKKNQITGLKIETINLPLNVFISSTSEASINKEILDSLHRSIDSAGYTGLISKKYSPYEILSLVEYALWFIRDQFRKQTSGNSKNVYRHYLIAQDGPFFDFPTFKAAARELQFTSNNLQQLQKLLALFYKAAIEITELWNQQIYLIEQKAVAKEDGPSTEVVRLEFNAETLSNSIWSNRELFENKPHDVYTNHAFATYASKIANLIGKDVFKRRDTVVRERPKDFLKDFLRGIQTLADRYEQNEFIQRMIKQGKKHEAPFRDYFSRWFENIEYVTNSEPLKGYKRIDLRIEHASMSKKIIEFKGWWNQHKTEVIQQLISYLTDFEGDGYIFIINHTNRNINDQYEAIIASEATGYHAGSWQPLTDKKTKYPYFTSTHTLGQYPKQIYHFIIQVPAKSNSKKVQKRKNK